MDLREKLPHVCNWQYSASRQCSADESGKSIVWGSGHTKGVNPETLDRLEIIAVRGPITASHLNIRSVAMGDPGLFAADLLPDRPSKRFRVGVLPNYQQKRQFFELSTNKGDAVNFIDLATRDYLSVVLSIAECEYIISSSLHGLVVADSLGIPNRWVDPFGISDAAHLKYYDYALSIDRNLGEPVPATSVWDVALNYRGTSSSELPYHEGIAKSRVQLLDALKSSRLVQ